MAEVKAKTFSRSGKEQKNENIQVFVRVRPQNAQERMEKCGKSATVVECNKDREIVVKERASSNLTKTFTFDRVFGPDSKQIDVYKTVVNPLIEEVLAGYNCTVFAYGQTGTGKTYTMEGERFSNDTTWEKDPQSGIIPRVLSHIFDELRLQQLEFTMGVSYLELYNEELIDLLSPLEDATKLRLFEDATQKGSLVIQGLQEIMVLDKKEVYEIMNKGAQKRQTAATLMNAHSSRSHTIFTVTVHIRENSDDGEELLRTGKINLVDLAGSENIGRSGAKQQRAREAGNINQSLLTLGRVITALVERTPHVPYRESKLTRLLQDSLGGRTKTSIIATISPVAANLEETLSTLDYAHRAKSITNRPEINQRLTKKTLLKEYTIEIERLRRDLEATRDGTGVYMAPDNYMHMTQRLEKQDVEISENIQRIRALEEERDKKEENENSPFEFRVESNGEFKRTFLVFLQPQRYVNAICDRLHMELEEKCQQLTSTAKSLEETQGTLVDTREELQRTEVERSEKEVLLESHMSTEEILSSQASTLLAVADQSTMDLEKVHDKLDRKSVLERQNLEAVQQFQEIFDQKLARMKDSVSGFSDEQIQQIGEVRSKLDETLKNTHKIDSKAHKEASSFLESHGHSLQALETHIRQQSEDRQLWSHAQLQSVRDAADSETKALHAALAQAYNRINTLTQEVETLKGNTANGVKESLRKVEAQEQVVRQFLQSHVESISEIKNLVRVFIQKMNAELQHSKDQIAETIEEHEATNKLETEVFSQLMQLIQKSDAMVKARRGKEQEHLKRMSDRVQESQVENDGFAASVENQLVQYEAQSNTLQRQHEEASRDIVNGMQQFGNRMINNLESVVEDHKALLTDNQAIDKMVERGWQEHASNMEHEMRAFAESVPSDLHSLGVHLQDLKDKTLQEAEEQSVFREARQTSLTEFIHAAQLQLSEQTSAMHSWSSKHNHELFECSQEVKVFLGQNLKHDQPTGNTPQRRIVEYPRILKATSPHESILQRFRSRQIQQRIPVTSPSKESLESCLLNKENGSKDLITNTKSTKPEILRSPSKNIQDGSNNTKRKVLATQN